MRRSIPQGCAERIVRRGSCHHAVCLLFVGALLHRDAGVYVVAYLSAVWPCRSCLPRRWKPNTGLTRVVLLHKNIVVDALLRRLGASNDEAPSTQKGCDGATVSTGIPREPGNMGARRPRVAHARRLAQGSDRRDGWRG
jgi:hypothetical protein